MPDDPRFKEHNCRLWPAALAVCSALCLVSALVYYLFFVLEVNPRRLIDPGTKLTPFERKVSGVSEEYMRRSAKLQAIVAEYGTCMPRCNSELMLRRDEAVRTDWPMIYERLIVLGDWQKSMRNTTAYMGIEDMLYEYGKETAVVACVPKIGLHGNKSTGPFVRFEKFVCLAP